MISSRVMYVLCPYRDEFKPVLEALDDVAKATGYTRTTALEDDAEPDIVRRIISGINDSAIAFSSLGCFSPA